VEKSVNKHIKEIGFCILIFIIFLAILEVVLRTTHLFGARPSWSKPDPIIGHRYSPGRIYWIRKENPKPITGRINKYGFRDKDWPLKKPEGLYRIAVIGDSYVEAFQVESDKTFLALTEKALNNRHNLKVELMNFGVSGVTQTEELMILQDDVLRFNPDMVILFFCPGNDIDDISPKTASRPRPFFYINQHGELSLDTSFSQTLSYKIKSFINPIKQHSALISLLAERYNVYQQSNRKITWEDKKTIMGALTLATAKPSPLFLENYRLNKLLIKRMAEICKDKGIRFLLVVEDINPKIHKTLKSIDPTYNPDFFEDDMRAFADSIGIEFLGLERAFREVYEKEGKSLHWGHWNYEGHELVAELLTKKLISLIGADNR